MNEGIKTFSLVIITICVFIITVIHILELLDKKRLQSSYDLSAYQDQPAAQQSNAPKTSIKFNEMNFDFGEIREGDVVDHTFVFTNTGSNPLIITDAKGSCGCTIPTYSKEPIAPGASGNIKVQFNSSGRKDEQDKTVTISANTAQPSILRIHAKVLEKQ